MRQEWKTRKKVQFGDVFLRVRVNYSGFVSLLFDEMRHGKRFFARCSTIRLPLPMYLNWKPSGQVVSMAQCVLRKHVCLETFGSKYRYFPNRQAVHVPCGGGLGKLIFQLTQFIVCTPSIGGHSQLGIGTLVVLQIAGVFLRVGIEGFTICHGVTCLFTLVQVADHFCDVSAIAVFTGV